MVDTTPRVPPRANASSGEAERPPALLLAVTRTLPPADRVDHSEPMERAGDGTLFVEEAATPADECLCDEEEEDEVGAWAPDGAISAANPALSSCSATDADAEAEGPLALRDGGVGSLGGLAVFPPP